MKFLNPWGLLVLLGIPVLILIFILTSRHEERGVSSTYVWKLSDRFVKKRLFAHSFKRFLLLALQILAVAAAAMFIARPTVTQLPNADYILVFDCSASMQVKDKDGVSRFERAKEEAKKMLDRLEEGHRFSLISASDEPAVLLEYCGKRDELELGIGALRPQFGGCDLDRAFELVNGVSAGTVEPRVILFTDRTPGASFERVEVRDLSGGEENAAALRLWAKETNKGYEFHGSAAGIGFDRTLPVILKIDGQPVDALEIELTDGEKNDFVFSEKVRSYMRAEMTIAVDDGLAEDNSFVLFRKSVKKRSVLLVSNSPLYLRTALRGIEGLTLETATSLSGADLKGKDVYVFDGVAPETLPRDGSCIFFNVSCPDVHLSLGENYEKEAAILRDHDSLSQLGGDFTENAETTVVSVFRALDVGVLWQNVLSCDGVPVMATRLLDNGRTVAAFSFDIHDTNLPLQVKFIRLITELMEFADPSLVEKADYNFGEQVEVHASKAGTVYVETPSGGMRYVEMQDAKGSFWPDALGSYALSASTGDGSEESARFFLHIPEKEATDGEISALPEVFVPEGTEQVREATREITFWIMIAMLAFLLLEWGLYIYEQY